jgi:MFS family permease
MLAVSSPSPAAVRRLAIARLVSVAGSVAADVALALVLYARTGSATWVGAALFIAFAVPALLSPVAGAISDRFDRRRVLVGSDVLGAACFAGMGLVSAPVALLALAAGAATASAPFLPASGSMLPAVAAPDGLARANSRLAVARTTGQLLGPVVGGGLVATVGGSTAFFVNAGSFLVSAALIGTLRGGFRAAPPDPDRRDGSGVMDGVRLVLRHPALRALTLGFVLVDVGNGLVMPAEVALADALGAGATGYGALVAVWGVGGLAGAHLAPALLDRRDEPRVLLAAAAGLAVAFGVAALAPWLWLALVAFVLGGATMSVAGVGEDVMLQRRVADAVRGRVYAAHIAAVQLSLAVPLLGAGALVDALGPQPVFGMAAGSVALGVAVLGSLLGRAGTTSASLAGD